ncbi:hypothetical protein RIF29_42159 [Crotalaria pallida]|uniref:Peptidase C2 calpain large subunit domain-containing protein n=1 Tax=Crotalaria pallida TaxID=3830 RepID=A0AAN9HW15_CROPI
MVLAIGSIVPSNVVNIYQQEVIIFFQFSSSSLDSQRKVYFGCPGKTFRFIFDQYIFVVYPPEMCYSVHGQWRGYSAGGCQDYDTWHQNPQFRLRATGQDASFPIHVFITLTQGVGFSRTSAGFRNYQSSHDSLMFYI